MDRNTMRATAREQLKGFCRVCPVCDGRACAGEVPGMGGVGTGGAFKANMDALARVKLNLRTIHAVKEPDMSLTLWGRTLAMPILVAPITGSSYNMGGKMTEEDFIAEMVAGALQAGTLCMTGDGADPTMFGSGIKAGKANNGAAIAIIKPRTQDMIRDHLRTAEEAGLLATGMDVDGAGLVTMAMKGQPVGPKTPAELRAWSVQLATDIYADPLAFQWPNHAKLFFNNKGVAANTTDICQQYPTGDMSLWVW